MSISKSTTGISSELSDPTGAGKTSLVKAILGTVPYSGSIRLAPELFRGRDASSGTCPRSPISTGHSRSRYSKSSCQGLQGHHGFRTPYNRKDRNRALKLIENAESPKSRKNPSAKYPGDRCNGRSSQEPSSPIPNSSSSTNLPISWTNRFEKELYQTLRELNDRMAIVMVSHDIGTHIQRREGDRLRKPQRTQAQSPISLHPNSCGTTTVRFR